MQKYHLTIDDYYDLAAIALCKAGLTFNSDKSNFSTYAYKCMMTSVFQELRCKKAEKRIPEHSLLYYQAEIENNDGDTASFINYIPSNVNIEDEVLAEVIFDEYTSKLKDRDKKIFALSKDGYKQKEICKIVGCSQSQVSRVKNKFIKYLAS